MASSIFRLEDDDFDDAGMFALPPDGQDNGVWANRWIVIAELEDRDVPRVMSKLAEADIGGYVAGAARMAHAGTQRRLYVDAMQFNQAMDAIMLSLRGKPSRDLAGYTPRRVTHSASAEPEVVSRRRSVLRMARTITLNVLGTAAVVVVLAAIFQHYVNRYERLHSHAFDRTHLPGIHQPIQQPSLFH